jgi:hypothetical protein
MFESPCIFDHRYLTEVNTVLQVRTYSEESIFDAARLVQLSDMNCERCYGNETILQVV